MIKKKNSILKIIYKKNIQTIFFGRSNIEFKINSMSKKKKFDNICNNFRLKKIINISYLLFSCIKINHL
jgi:hypothetical protein